MSQLAASFAHRVGTLVSNISSPRSPGTMPTDAEIEADAQRERDRSRREAERILTAEAEERRMVEERVLAMIDSTRGSPYQPSRSHTLPNPPSPSPSSQKDKDGAPSWWIAAKNRLTPTKDKEPLTPAQQVIQDAKLREKDRRNSKGKEKEAEWPVNPQGKYTDPAFLTLNIPSTPPPRRAGHTTPSPTPSRPSLSNMPPNLSPSPMRMSADGKASPSPSREPPPMYAQFNSQGTLDVPGTLLTIAKRFEKLEKWTVGHVRALEERMSDVERWLVDKEKEKEEKSIHEGEPAHTNASSHPSEELTEMKEHVEELQGRVGALGREMAKLAAAAAAAPSSGARVSRPLPQISPQTSPNATSIGVPTNTVLSSNPIVTTPHTRIASSTAFESTSPPMTSAKSSGRTRLPYPTGDYATPPDSSILAQGAFSPTNSPPSSITSATRARPVSISGLPSFSQTQSNTSGLPITTSPTARVVSPSSNLPPPKPTAPRNTSVSPTPRKRYTVALGAPLNDPSERLEYQPSDDSVFSSRPQSSMGTAFFSSSLVGNEDEDESATTKEDEFDDETIGKSSAARLAAVNQNKTGTNSYLAPSPSPSNSNPRIRAQSIYGLSSLQPPPSPITPLKPRVRSRSTDRFGLGISMDYTGGSKFVDPLVLRKQEQGSTGTKLAMPKPIGKIPIGQLVAFFDGEKKDHN